MVFGSKVNKKYLLTRPTPHKNCLSIGFGPPDGPLWSAMWDMERNISEIEKTKTDIWRRSAGYAV